MSVRKFIPAFALATSLGAAGVLALIPIEAEAQAANAPAPAAQAPGPAQQRPMRPSHIEGRIAFMKAELKITPAQEDAFDKVAQAMRQNDTERRRAFEQMRASHQPGQHPNALQRLEGAARFSAMRTQETDRVLAAFRPLYDSLSDTQKKAADDLYGFHGHGHFHGRH